MSATGDPRHRLGLEGERLAARCLLAAGMRVLERRYRDRRGEIDLIAEDGEVLVFTEVKTRRDSREVAPADGVDAAKRRRLGRVALGYLQQRGWLDRPSRFDVVEVAFDVPEQPAVHHIVDAFRLGGGGEATW